LTGPDCIAGLRKPKTGLTNRLQDFAEDILSMPDFDKRQCPDGFVPLLDPLPPLTNVIPEDIRQLGFYMNRSAYEELFNSTAEKASQGQKLFILTGSPGIGKSLCSLYFCLQLIVKKLAKYVIMTTTTFEDKTVVWDIAEQKIYKFESGHSKKIVDLLADEPDAWLLLDGPNKKKVHRDYHLELGKSIWFLSPNKDIIVPLETKSSAKVYYMPPWTLDELKVCNQCLYKVKWTVFYERYNYFGGIPRYVFGSFQDKYQAYVEEALLRSDIMDNPEDLAKKNVFLDEFSHKLLVILPEGLEDYSLDFVSHETQVRVIEHYRKNASRKLREFLRITQGNPKLGALRGKFFEPHAHDVLCQGGKFSVRNLLSGEELNFTFAQRACSWYSRGNSTIIYESNTGTNPYSRPRSETQGGFDSFDNVYFFQMTVSETKEVNMSFVEENLQDRKLPAPSENQVTVKLVIVLPDDTFPKFIKPASLKYNTTEAPPWAKYIQQYVLSIPLEATFPEISARKGGKKAQIKAGKRGKKAQIQARVTNEDIPKAA
jgi:hypothetical protein